MNTITSKPHRRLKWFTLLGLIILTCLIWVYSQAKSTAGAQWQELTPGLEYTTLDLNPGTLHAFKIDLAQNRLGLISPTEPTTVKEMALNAHALVTTNAGFFTPEGEPLGLRINEGKKLTPLKAISWWGIFYLQNDIPRISSFSNFKLTDDINFAVQAGPRLLVNKSTPHLKEGVDNRTAIGYNADKKVILIVTEDAQLTTLNLAKILGTPEKKGGLGCIYALNLDGGSSSQVYAEVGDFTLDVPNYRPVADGLAVFAR